MERAHVVWLTLGGILALSLAFALGVIVGRRAAKFSDAGSHENAVSRADAAGNIHDKLTFYDKLTTNHPKEPHNGALAAKGPTAGRASSGHATAEDADSAVRTALARGPAESGEYTVQVSAYQSMAEATAFMASLKRKGFTPFVVKANLGAKGTWYRVRLGRFDNEPQATRAKEILDAADIPAWVLKSE